VITGAAFGIGRATAELFAREGARLTVTDIQGEPLLALADELRQGGAEIETVVGDVSVEEDARRMIGAAVDRFGRLDVLVANAGIIPLGDATEITAADWDDVMAIDGRGMFLTCKFAIEAMVPTGGGAIVCLSSISGLAGQKRQAAYGPAKFVATGLTKHLAVEWADRGIRVNAVAPERSAPSGSGVSEEPGGSEYLAAVERMHPMGRSGEPAEDASAIVFLASDDASFITGAVLPVDGGFLAQ
jgi:NAD(P)-dependent dehydrogenase (short-subunit alcohol dehydrogenase family)